MPIYEYRCSECGSSFERLLLPAKDQGVSCPRCSSEDVARIPSTFAVGRSNSGGSPGAACCGLDSPCEDPKRCCEV